MAHVIITGFMATGKTEVGRRLAHMLGRPFVDTDGLVESAAGRTIAHIFATDGEARFRELECAAVREACALPDAVIATGGGTLLDPQNRQTLLAAGPVICLTARPEEIAGRIGDSPSRPLLANGTAADDTLARIRALLAERASVYALATHHVSTSGMTPDEVVERVRTLVEGQ